MTDADLAARAAGGDRSAFVELFDRHGDRVHDHVARWSRDATLAADATQEAFVALLGALDEVSDEQSVLSWLLSTARARAVDQLRQREDSAPTPAADIPTAVLAAVPTEASTPPDEAVRTHATAELVWDVVADLEEQAFSVLDLDVRQRLSSDDIAVVVGVDPDEATVLVNRMRVRMRTLFGAALLLHSSAHDCAQLEELRRAAPVPVDMTAARRIRDHAEQCTTCGPRRVRSLAPLRTYRTLAIVRAPVAVSAAVLAAVSRHFGPTSPRPLRNMAAMGLAAVVLVLLAGVAAALRSGEPTPDAGPPTAAAEIVPSPSPTPLGARTPGLQALVSPSPVPVASPEPTVAPEPTADPTPAPSPSPTAVPLTVRVDQPAGSQSFPATQEDGEGRQAAAVQVAATVQGGSDAVEVAWTSNLAPDQTLLAKDDGSVLLWLGEPCTTTRHTLTVTATDPQSGETAAAAVEVTATETCEERLAVAITEPSGASVTATREPGDTAHTATFDVAAVADGDDGSLRWTWTSDRAPGEPLLQNPSGRVSIVIDDCPGAADIVLTVEAEREADGSTATDQVTLSVTCDP